MKSMLFKVSFVFILACLMLFGFQSVTMAGVTGKIAGMVKDADTGEALPGVNVVLVGTTQGAATDVDGHYFIVNIPPGTYSVTASMIGYTSVRKTEVLVSTDRTTTIDFDLKVTAITGEEVTIVAEREIVPMDVSASHIVAEAEEIVQVPMVTDLSQYINMQAGIEGMVIRGGGMDQTQFMMDGLMVVDQRVNKPMMMVNLSAVKELNVIKGGFSAEYGNVRSGLINVITKEGSPSAYHASIDARISVPRLKHSGNSIFEPDNYQLRSYLDPAVCWAGTENGTWDEYKKNQNLSFIGWNAYSEALLADDDPTNDMTPGQAQQRFIWLHRSQAKSEWGVIGSGELGQKEGEYGHKPDWNADVSFGGPVPIIGKYLGNLSFFTSYRNNWEMFGLPQNREYFKEENQQLKLTSRLSSSMKLTLEGLYGEINSISRDRSIQQDNYLTSGYDNINSNLSMYYPVGNNPYDLYRSMIGLSFDHVLSPTTFYNVRISRIAVNNVCGGKVAVRDTTNIKQFGSVWVDEAPFGIPPDVSLGRTLLMTDGMYYGAHAAGARDWSNSETLSLKFDLTSQINRYNQLKVGLLANYDDLNTHYEMIRWESPGGNTKVKWQHFPYRVGAYVQDKLEFEGMIANFGLRLDYNEPNCDWYTVDRYSRYLTKEYKNVFTDVAEKEAAEGHWKISPRLGISHPISAHAKLYFNYGHFYSMPQSSDMYEIDYGMFKQVAGIRRLGNPSAELPRTIQYELGWEYNLLDMFLLHVSGYYKDVSDQTGDVWYTNYEGSVDYATVENNNYADIRGFELRIDKRWGKWLTGWINYNYLVSTSGYIGREHYYEDPREQRIYGLQNPYQERPLARPVLRANILLKTPGKWGPAIGNIKPLGDIHVSSLFTRKAGRYETWDPLETFELEQNLQWKARYSFDLRLSKMIRTGKYTFTLFADVQNLFNLEYLDSRGFADAEDKQRYYESLHLPMYEGEQYKQQGYTPGNDKPGDVKSDDKPYIDMPNLEYLTYFGQRTIFFGFKFDF